MADPVYRQIADDLRQRIGSGEFGRGDQLPTEIELREQYNASRNTVRDAVKSLITRGLIETRPGQGTFVVGKIDPYVTILTDKAEKGGDEEAPVYVKGAHDAEQRGPRQPATGDPRVEIQKAVTVHADELQLAPGATVVCRHQRRYIDNTPWSLQTSFYPMSLVSRGAERLSGAENIVEGAVEYLREELGIKQVGYSDMIIVRAPDPDETTFFKLPDDGRVAVLEIRRTAYDDHGTPFRLTVSVYPADRNQFVRIVGKVPAAETDPAPDDIHAGPSGRHHA